MEGSIVLLSGGQDSTTCLYWAKKHFDKVHAVIFEYRQRHVIEVEAAKRIAGLARVPFTVLPMNAENGGTALGSGPSAPDPQLRGGALPNTFIPGRNLLFLTMAAAYAYRWHDFRNLVIGCSAVDYSGYPDCRLTFLQRAQMAINAAMDTDFLIHAPLLTLSKRETVLLAKELGCLHVLGKTWTCYNPQHGKAQRFKPCAVCPACELRAKGFADAGVTDPAPKEGLHL